MTNRDDMDALKQRIEQMGKTLDAIPKSDENTIKDELYKFMDELVQLLKMVDGILDTIPKDR